MRYQISPPPMNPVSRLLAGLAAFLALAGAVFFGIFVLALVAGLGFVIWLVVGLRFWWLRKTAERSGVRPKARGPGQDSHSVSPDGESGKVIEAEYEVVSRRRDP